MGRYQALVLGCILSEKQRRTVFYGDGEPIDQEGADLVVGSACADHYIGFRVADPEMLPDLVQRGPMRAERVNEGTVVYRHRRRLETAKRAWAALAAAMRARGVELPDGSVLLVEDYD